MFELQITPELLAMIVAGLLAILFDWFPKLSPWFDGLSDLKKRQLMGALLFATVLVIYGGLCINLFSSLVYACNQVSLAELINVAFLVIFTNQSIHIMFKPTANYKFDRQVANEKGQGMVEYALILVLVAVVVIAALTLMGPIVASIFESVNANL